MSINTILDMVLYKYVRRALPLLDASMRVFLKDEFARIEQALNSQHEASIQVADKAPENPKKGMVRYAVSPWDPLSNGFSGLVVYNGTAWVAV